MFQKVIYKRQYNKPTIEEIEAEIADEPIPAEVKEPAPSKYKCSSKDIFKPSKYQRTTKLTLKSDKMPGQSR